MGATSALAAAAAASANRSRSAAGSPSSSAIVCRSRITVGPTLPAASRTPRSTPPSIRAQAARFTLAMAWARRVPALRNDWRVPAAGSGTTIAATSSSSRRTVAR
ncbi:MAG: hypothetical protein IPI34_13100 [bacterium]|nr:hypothetical protein [bacterium]